MSKPCETCKFRGAFDRDRNSLLGRVWRWHIKFCPGWRLYYNSLDAESRQALAKKYDL